MENNDNKKPYKLKDVTRNQKKGIVATTLEEVRNKACEKFDKMELPAIHLDSDGTEIDDEDYFQTLEANTELIAVFPGEQWIDPTHYVTITTRRNSSGGGDMTDSTESEKTHLKSLVGRLKNNMCNISILSDPDLELLANMDPNMVADVTGKDFVEQLKEASGRLLHEKREAYDAVELLRIFAQQKSLYVNDGCRSHELQFEYDDLTNIIEKDTASPNTTQSNPTPTESLESKGKN